MATTQKNTTKVSATFDFSKLPYIEVMTTLASNDTRMVNAMVSKALKTWDIPDSTLDKPTEYRNPLGELSIFEAGRIRVLFLDDMKDLMGRINTDIVDVTLDTWLNRDLEEFQGYYADQKWAKVLEKAQEVTTFFGDKAVAEISYQDGLTVIGAINKLVQKIQSGKV